MENKANDNQNQNDKGKEGENKGQNVTLTAEQYNTILEKLEEFEKRSEKGPRKREVSNVDDLAEVGTTREVTREEKLGNLDELSNTELVNKVVEYMGEQYYQPLMTMIHTIRLEREVEKASAAHEDFWDYADYVYEIASENPKLSIEKAYKLAKDEYGDKVAKKTSKEKVLINLPPKPPLGEKPSGIHRESTQEGEPKSVEAAVKKAYAEVFEKTKT